MPLYKRKTNLGMKNGPTKNSFANEHLRVEDVQVFLSRKSVTLSLLVVRSSYWAHRTPNCVWCVLTFGVSFLVQKIKLPSKWLPLFAQFISFTFHLQFGPSTNTISINRTSRWTLVVLRYWETLSIIVHWIVHSQRRVKQNLNYIFQVCNHQVDKRKYVARPWARALCMQN